MNKVRLSDVIEINPHGKQSYSPDALVGFIPMAAVSETGAISAIVTRPFSEVSRGFTTFKNGDVLFAKITPCMENGKASIVKGLHSEHGFGSTEFHVLRPRPEIKVDYLFHLIHNSFFRKSAAKNMSGSAGQKRVPVSFFSDYEISLPPLPDQIRIAAVLTRAEKLIAKRKESIKALDELLNCSYAERFVNGMFPFEKLENLSIKITDGEHLRPAYTDFGMPFISVVNVTKKYLSFENCKYVSMVDFNKFTKRCKPERNDVLYTKVGATFGRAALVDTDRPFCLYVSVALIKPKHSLINAKYLQFTMNHPIVINQANRSIKGAGVPDLHLIEIKNFKIPMPPISEQEKFAALVERVESLKTKYTLSLTELENLYASLSQRAFKGELDLSKVSINQPRNNLEPFKRIPRPKFNERYKDNVPLLPLRIAAGGFSEQQCAEWGDWAEIKTSQPIAKGWFVAQVVGDSMEPLIPKGAYCLFKPFFLKAHKDKVLLIQQHEEDDPETGGKYTLKMIEQKTGHDTSGIVEVRLVSLNPKYPPKIYHEDPHLKPIAEFVEVLGN